MAAPVLKQLALTDLNLRYARKMSENTIRHYIVPMSMTVMSHFSGNTPDNLVKEYIKENEGIDVIVEPVVSRTDNSLKVTNVSNSVLAGRNDIKRALSKFTTKQLIHQTPVYGSKFDTFKAMINWKVILPINNLIARFKTGKSIPNSVPMSYHTGIPYFRVAQKYNKVHLTHYLVIAFQEDEFKDAAKALVKDLDILLKNKLILGNLTMPSLVPLADTVGDGKKVYALICYVLIDSDVKEKLIGKEEYGSPKPSLKQIGIKYECAEGSVNFLDNIDPRDKYEIEEINIADGINEKNRQAYIESYNSTVEHVNSVAQDMNNKMDQVNIEKSSEILPTNTDYQGRPVGQLKVNFNIVKKTEE